MLCIYHLADNDGKGSAAIVKSKYPQVECFGLNHDMEVPFDLIARHDQIIICDICLPMPFLMELNQSKDITWIDHHASAIAQYEQCLSEGNCAEVKGLRKIGTAAIVLTWQYFYPQKPLPEGVKLLGLNDIFDLTDERVRPFEYAFQSQGVNKPEDEVWTKLFAGKTDIDAMVEKGKAILSWIKIRNYRLLRSLAFASEVFGHRCICANMPQGYSEFYDSLPNLPSYDFMVNFYMNDNNCWNLSFYTLKDNIDVSKIAARFGGGGHAKAAGASSLKELPEFLAKGINVWREKK